MELVRYMPRTLRANRLAPFTRLFDEFFTPFAGVVDWPAKEEMLPSVDIYEKDGKVIIDAELPGVAKEDIHVDVKERLLTLSAERKSTEEVKEENAYRRERRYGKFERTFNLAFDIDSEKVEAKYENGILTLTIPRPEAQQPKQITVH